LSGETNLLVSLDGIAPRSITFETMPNIVGPAQAGAARLVSPDRFTFENALGARLVTAWRRPVGALRS
jgi:hypothetical protein